MKTVSAFEVWIHGCEWSESHRYVTNAHTAGKAKMEYIRMVDGMFDEIPFTRFRARKIGRPVTNEQFIRNAEYRGMPNVRCGDRCKVGAATGIIVGHNASANFDVLFDEDSPKYAGMRLNVHPADVELPDQQTEEG